MLTTLLFTLCIICLYHLFIQHSSKTSDKKQIIAQPYVTKYKEPVDFNNNLKDELSKDLENLLQM